MRGGSTITSCYCYYNPARQPGRQVRRNQSQLARRDTDGKDSTDVQLGAYAYSDWRPLGLRPTICIQRIGFAAFCGNSYRLG